jgi:hypothetical protein
MFYAAISVLIVGSGAASAATLVLQQGLNSYTGTRDDAALQSTDPSTYPNLDNHLYAYSNISGPNLGTVVGFDTSSLPPNAVINSATLTMTFDENSNFGNGAAQGFEVKDPSAQWAEGQVNYYFAQNTGPGVLWNASDQPFGAGGTGITMASQPVLATASVSGATLAGVGLNFDVTSLVTGWENGSIQNRGFAVLNDGTGAPNGNIYWAGKANSTEAWRPELTIGYSVPEPGTAAIAALGAITILRRRRGQSGRGESVC